MAEMTTGPEMGEAGVGAGALVRVAGAMVSLGLLVGMGVWGYKLVVRDANGIPVVAAMEGPMRETPTDPGGTLAVNTGLAVNTVVAEGGASDPEDVLLLAPATPGLTEEDLLVQPTAEEDEVVPGELAGVEVTPQADPNTTPASLGVVATEEIVIPSSDEPMTADEILALADQIAAGVAPLEELSGEVIQPTLEVDGAVVTAAIERISTSIPGVTQAYRPPARPLGLNVTPAVAVAEVDTVPTVPAVDTSAIDGALAQAQTEVAAVAPVAIGSTLVQLGAFDSADEARSEWSELNQRFAAFMADKELVIQQAESGGRQFFRLRAMGFADIADARRFCSALVAEEAACIPVVVQ